MADVTPVIAKVSPGSSTPEIYKYTITPLTNANVDSGVMDMSGLGADRTVHIIGTFDSATVVIKGSYASDGTFTVLTDPQGNALSKTAAAVEAITEMCPFMKVTTSGGSGSQSVTVVITARRT